MRRVAVLCLVLAAGACSGVDDVGERVTVRDGRVLFAMDEATCAVAAPLCDKRVACARGEPGADLEAVCVIGYLGAQRSLRANDEPECTQLADALLAYDTCKAQLDCEAFNANDHGGACATERQGWLDAYGAAGSECLVTD